MPTFADIASFLGRQYFRTPVLASVDLTGKVFVITGANTGLGLDAVKHLVRLGASTVILGCRDVDKGKVALESITSITPSHTANLEVWKVDLDSYDSVLEFGARVSSLPRLDGFIANAGMEPKEFNLVGGIESTLQVNVISTMLSCLSVLPALRKTAEQYGSATLEIVGSMGHTFGDPQQLETVPLDTDLFEALSDPETAQMPSRYSLSKLMVHLATHQLARKVPSGVIVNIVNPGWCGTGLTRYAPYSGIVKVMFGLMGRTSEEGSRTLVHGLVAGPESSGRYLSECIVVPESSYMQTEMAQETGKRVWKDLCARFSKLSPELLNGMTDDPVHGDESQ